VRTVCLGGALKSHEWTQAVLMQALVDHCVGGGVYSHAHEEGVVLLGDNRTCIHRASDGDVQGHARHLVRIQAEEPHPLERWRAKV
jgi:alpha-ketoglutarate-dependent taurine dioxygenase